MNGEHIDKNKKALIVIVLISGIIAAIMWGIAVYVHKSNPTEVVTKEIEVMYIA